MKILKIFDKVMTYSVFLIIVLGLLVAGCASTPEIRTVTKTEYKVIDFPNELLRDCPVTTPPNPDEYVEAELQDREGILTNYTIALLKDIALCNDQISKLRDLKKSNLDIINNLNKPKVKE